MGNDLVLDAAGTFAARVTERDLPATCRIDVTITPADGTQGCGILLRGSDDFEQGYYVRLEPHRDRLVFDSWPRPGDRPYAVELERPLAMRPGTPIRLTVLLDGTCCVVYADNGTAPVAMSTRLYDRPAGCGGVFVQEGCARFGGLALRVRSGKETPAAGGA
jgi:beta-fructofuranosidase